MTARLDSDADRKGFQRNMFDYRTLLRDFSSVHWTVTSHYKSFGLVPGVCPDGFRVRMVHQRAKCRGIGQPIAENEI